MTSAAIEFPPDPGVIGTDINYGVGLGTLVQPYTVGLFIGVHALATELVTVVYVKASKSPIGVPPVKIFTVGFVGFGTLVHPVIQFVFYRAC